MQKLLVTVEYVDNKGKFWFDGYIKNKIALIDETKNLHAQLAEFIKASDYVEFAAKVRPTAPVFVDDKDGETKQIGFIYKVKTEIEGKQVRFDAWVTIRVVTDYPFNS